MSEWTFFEEYIPLLFYLNATSAIEYVVSKHQINFLDDKSRSFT